MSPAKTSPKKPRVSKAEWFEAALHLLKSEGSKAVHVERMARELGTSRSGFYWHFADRDDLMEQMLTYWACQYTGVVTDDPLLLKLDPATRLLTIMELVLDHGLAEFDLSLRAWAAHDPKVAREFERVMRERLDYIRAAFSEIGFEGEELEMRTRLFVCYHSWEHTTFPRDSKKKLRSLIPRRHALLVSPHGGSEGDNEP